MKNYFKLMEKEKTYIEELIRIIRPTNKNHVFNENDYDIITTTDKDGTKLVILREKSN